MWCRALFASLVALSGSLASSKSQLAASTEALLRVAAAAGQDSACSDTAAVSKDTCLGKSTKCMFLEFDKRNLCLPCEWSGANLPCVPEGAAYPQGTVRSCDMSCDHQEIVSKVSDCTDLSGDISQPDCYEKGSSAGISCMWTAYRQSSGRLKTMCGPCNVDGYGVLNRAAPGTPGPEAGSIVEHSFSQCEDRVTGRLKPCFDPEGCPRAVAPMPPSKGDKPVVTDVVRLGMNTTADAPKYYAVPVPPPYKKEEFVEAAAVAAKAAGWKKPVKEIDTVNMAMSEPDLGPDVPKGISKKPVGPLPGLLYPDYMFKPKPGPGILAEPGTPKAFIPKIVTHMEASLLQGFSEVSEKDVRYLRGQR